MLASMPGIMENCMTHGSDTPEADRPPPPLLRRTLYFEQFGLKFV